MHGVEGGEGGNCVVGGRGEGRCMVWKIGVCGEGGRGGRWKTRQTKNRNYPFKKISLEDGKARISTLLRTSKKTLDSL